MTIVFYIVVAFYVFLVLSAMGAVMLDNRQPVKTIAWLLVLLLIPIVGLVLYYFFGQNIRREFVMSKRNIELLTQKVVSYYVNQEQYSVPERFQSVMLMMKKISFALPFGGNVAKFYTRGASFLSDLLSDIAHAQQHVHVEFYIMEDDELGGAVATALKEAVARGVSVKLIYDDVGCWSVARRFFREMREAGIDVQPFQPVHFRRLSHRVNYRNHRKIVIVDGRVGYTGGMNLASRYIHGEHGGDWRDLHFRVEGAAVYGLQQLFLADWFYASQELINDMNYYPKLSQLANGGALMQIVMSAPLGQWNNIQMAYNHLIQSAREYILIQTPYFMPTETLLEALQTAALRGVKVQVMVPLKPGGFWMTWANESFYGDVLKAGGEIYAYRPGMLHAKALVIDGVFCSVGSANMDFRSLNDTFEGTAFFYDEKIAEEVKALYNEAKKACMRVDLHMWNHRNRRRRLLESFVRIFSPLF